jgi:hypothetical protein
MSGLVYEDDEGTETAVRPNGAGTVRRAGAEPWRGHFVDVGLSIGGTYFRLVIGRERRSPQRRKQDRAEKPLSTIGNMLFAGSISGIVFTVLIVVVLVYSSILSD